MDISKEIFGWIIGHKHDLFSLNDYKTWLCVSKSFVQLLAKHAESFIIDILRLVFTHGEKVSRYWFKHTVYPLFKSHLSPDLRTTVKKILANTKNLIKNPSCSLNLEHWHVTKNGGSGWSVESWAHLMPKKRITQKAFCGSYSDCEMEQTVDISTLLPLLLSESQCVIEGGAYVARRYDCCCTAKVTISLYGEDAMGKKLLAVKESEDESKNEQKEPNKLDEKSVSMGPNLPATSPLTPGHCYKLAAMRFTDAAIVAATKKVQLKIWTKDTQFWAGFYAARFTDMYIRVIPLSYYSKPPT